MWHHEYHGIPLQYVWIIGSKQPQKFSPRHAEKILRKKVVYNTMSEIGIRNSIDLFKNYIADQNDLKNVLGDYKINSDYFPYVEFATDPYDPPNEILKKLVTNVRSDSVYDHIDWTGYTEEQKTDWLEDYDRIFSKLKARAKRK